jgi:hypothetical protein
MSESTRASVLSRTAFEPSRARVRPKPEGTVPLLKLRDALGNRAIGSFLQTQLTVGRPDDTHEMEADQVADQVMSMPEASGTAPAIRSLSSDPGHRVRLQMEEEEPEEEEPEEEISDAGGLSIQRRCVACEEEEAGGGMLQRQAFLGDEFEFAEADEEEEAAVQTKPQQSAGLLSMAAGTGSRVQSLLGHGEPLGPSLRTYFEPRFGRDFGAVRTHTGPVADETSRALGARAYTFGSNIAFRQGAFSPESDDGRRLLAHELTHVIQQSGASGIHSIGSRGYDGLLQRAPEETEALISRHTSWGNLDETALGRELLRLALGGQLTLTDEVLNTLGSTNRDDVVYEFMLAATDPQLVHLAAATASRQFLHRLFDELTSGSVSAEEQQQADRILQVTARQTVSVGAFEAAATSRRTKIFPFRLPGFTVLNDAPIEARRERGGVWVHSFVRVLGTAEFRAETTTLPTEYFLSGIVLPETEVIGVRLYDQGGIIHYTTPPFLIQLANATNQQVLEKILETVGIGLTFGTGALAGLGVEAGMAARVLLWADRAAFALGTLTSVLREHRSWLVAQFGAGFVDAVDTVHSATAIYGLARVVFQAPRLVQGLRDSYRAFREAARSRSSGFSSAEQTTIQQVTQSSDNLIEQIDNIEGARPAARPSAAEPTTPPPSAEPRPAEAAPVGPRGTRETPLERGSSGAAAPAAAGAGGGYRPTQAELESYADRAWRMLGGRGPRPAVTETPLPPNVAGQFWSSPPTIQVGTGASSPGSVIDTVWHEASHGRIRELIGFMNEHLGGSWRRTLLRPLDEIVSYFIGGLGRVIQGPTVSSRLFGILNMLGAPVSAIGSMATTAERALWAVHMLPFAAALIWAEVKILLAIRERRGSGTSQRATAP